MGKIYVVVKFHIQKYGEAPYGYVWCGKIWGDGVVIELKTSQSGVIAEAIEDATGAKPE